MYWLSFVKRYQEGTTTHTGRRIVVKADSLKSARRKMQGRAKKLRLGSVEGDSYLYITNQLHGPYMTEGLAVRHATPYYFRSRKCRKKVCAVWRRPWGRKRKK